MTNTNAVAHENRIGLPWVYVRLLRGSFGDQTDIFNYLDFDMHSKPKKDSTGHWIFSLKDQGEDVCMVRCWGAKAKEHALQMVGQILDNREVCQ